MHLIIPAVDLVTQLYRSLLLYATQYDNPMVRSWLLSMQPQLLGVRARRPGELVPSFTTPEQFFQHLLQADNDRNPPLEVRTLRHYCYCIVNVTLQDAVERQQRWRTALQRGDRLDELLLTLMPDWSVLSVGLASDHFNVHVLDDNEQRIDEWVSMAMEGYEWHMWNVHEIGSDLILSRGEDYRVVDWERRMKSGEWKPELHPDALIDLGINSHRLESMGETTDDAMSVNEAVLKQPLPRFASMSRYRPRSVPGAGVPGPLCTRGEAGTEVHIMEENPLLKGAYRLRRVR